MEELLKKLEETNFDREEECLAILDSLEEELDKVDKALTFTYPPTEVEVVKGRANLLAFLDSATIALSLIPGALRRKASILGRLQSFVSKVLQSLKKYAQSLKVDSYSITIGISPSITLTFKP